jgi:hypothetical protein
LAFEIKLDGVRAIGYSGRAGLRLLSREVASTDLLGSVEGHVVERRSFSAAAISTPYPSWSSTSVTGLRRGPTDLGWRRGRKYDSSSSARTLTAWRPTISASSGDDVIRAHPSLFVYPGSPASCALTCPARRTGNTTRRGYSGTVMDERVDYPAITAVWRAGKVDRDVLVDLLTDAWADEYRRRWPGGELVEFSDRGARYLFDMADGTDRSPRTVAELGQGVAGQGAGVVGSDGEEDFGSTSRAK